ncbi:MAG: AEC family transporter [Gammaproteobacteria bacterium]|nr:AEC family transporter [Gammaproteobacteria bacterium]
MLATLSITSPVFLLILLGFVATRRGWVGYEDSQVLSRYALRFALPALMFGVIAERPLSEVVVPAFLWPYALGSLLGYGIGLGVATLLRRGHPLDNGFYGMGVSMSNSGYIGYALIAQLFGQEVLIAVAMAILVEVLLIMPLTLMLAELHLSRAQHGFVRALGLVLTRVMRNPILQAIAAGLAFAVLGLRLPSALARTLDMLASSAAAVALFAIGATLAGQHLRKGLGEAAAIALGKLLLHPLAVGLMLMLGPPLDPVLRNAALLLAALPMVTIYPLLAQRYGQEERCASALVLATLLSFVTLNLWLMMLDGSL